MVYFKSLKVRIYLSNVGKKANLDNLTTFKWNVLHMEENQSREQFVDMSKIFTILLRNCFAINLPRYISLSDNDLNN